ncbi:ComE operon protein 1 [Kroppenstedtia guangzhouensis]|uniref:ComE operon protein 1 n=1 Tax=Kroppenstedtia guangzhouensis TaxID=1274356 RepID=A0ABQ1G4E1_9BACL|nr:helix-hairpin-helix domain-containing protein [Kroppenstedtia guangzhouensis]GGA36831.1 ComE operon protein 1 [Kroppenstedtia guangzhouensis]
MWDQGGWTPREKGLAVAVGALLLLLAGVGISLWAGDEKQSEAELQPYPPPSETAVPKEEDKGEEPTELVVDVKGEVKHPGVYRLSPGARVEEALGKAGGPLKRADMDRVNLAQPLSDGMALYIPAKGEEIPPGVTAGAPVTSGSGGEAGQTVNVNTASAEELQQLSGIGPSKAEAIIRYREENGSFTSVDQLTEVPGIGEKTLDQLRDQVTVQ